MSADVPYCQRLLTLGVGRLHVGFAQGLDGLLVSSK